MAPAKRPYNPRPHVTVSVVGIHIISAATRLPQPHAFEILRNPQLQISQALRPIAPARRLANKGRADKLPAGADAPVDVAAATSCLMRYRGCGFAGWVIRLRRTGSVSTVNGGWSDWISDGRLFLGRVLAGWDYYCGKFCMEGEEMRCTLRILQVFFRITAPHPSHNYWICSLLDLNCSEARLNGLWEATVDVKNDKYNNVQFLVQ